MTTIPARSVLVVDDDAPLASLVAVALGAKGYEVRTAADGMEGLSEIEQRRPDLVLSDIWMPCLNGYELAARLIDDGHRIPLVLMSGFVPEARTSRLRFLRKPFDTAGLLSAVEEALADGEG